MDFLQALIQYLGNELIGDPLMKPELIARCLAQRLMNPFNGYQITYVFDESSNDSVTIRGLLPHVGDDVWFRTYNRESPFNKRNHWIVKRVTHSITIFSDRMTQEEKFRKLLLNESLDTIDYEVLLTEVKDVDS